MQSAAANMVRQVLSFARGVEGERVALQPKHLIKEIVKILRETLPKSIEITYHLPNDLWIISADATQMHQVLMNLCVNARDAMPDGGSNLNQGREYVCGRKLRAHAHRGQAGSFCDDYRVRYRTGNVAGDSEQDLRAVLYHQGDD